MSSFIFVCFIFALVPAILWIIPKTRRSSGMIMTALKTVPLGMLAFFALNHLPQNMALLSGTLCWAIIILLAAFIRKRYKANWKYPAFIFLVAIPFSVWQRRSRQVSSAAPSGTSPTRNIIMANGLQPPFPCPEKAKPNSRWNNAPFIRSWPNMTISSFSSATAGKPHSVF